eukprot:2283567-Rhodomonas_salina.3
MEADLRGLRKGLLGRLQRLRNRLRLLDLLLHVRLDRGLLRHVPGRRALDADGARPALLLQDVVVPGREKMSHGLAAPRAGQHGGNRVGHSAASRQGEGAAHSIWRRRSLADIRASLRLICARCAPTSSISLSSSCHGTRVTFRGCARTETAMLPHQ